MLRKSFEKLKSIYFTLILYLGSILTLMSPGTFIWKYFGEKKGKIRLINRYLICDCETLINEGKSFQPLDEFTNALEPFIPLFLISNIQQWKQRRDLFSFGNSLIDQRLNLIDFNEKLSEEKGNIHPSLFRLIFRYSFHLVFNRQIKDEEFQKIYSGLDDINRILKRISSKANMKKRFDFYYEIRRLIEENENGFLFHKNDRFFQMNEIDQISSIGEDFLTTMSVQCTDLICHLLILYSEYSEEFHRNLSNCFNETLRLYPLTDLWVRQSKDKKSNWISSLIQLNRNGWKQPNEFLPDRWNSTDHPPLMSWGFDIRRCPAQQIATKISKKIFLKIIEEKSFWIEKAKNFDHERTFPFGCQLWIGYGIKPQQAQHWIYPNKFQMKIQRWINEKIRMIDQFELN